MAKRILINNQIRAEKVRLIGEDGKYLGVFELKEALKQANQKELDLIEIAEKAEPPVCKIGDYKKYLYQEEKKKQKVKKTGGLKNLRLSFNISKHDLETRLKTVEKFLKKGYKVRVEMRLRGREKALSDFAGEKINKFLEILKESTPFKIERELKRESQGLTIIISKA